MHLNPIQTVSAPFSLFCVVCCAVARIGPAKAAAKPAAKQAASPQTKPPAPPAPVQRRAVHSDLFKTKCAKWDAMNICAVWRKHFEQPPKYLSIARCFTLVVRNSHYIPKSPLCNGCFCNV